MTEVRREELPVTKVVKSSLLDTLGGPPQCARTPAQDSSSLALGPVTSRDLRNTPVS